MKNQRRPRGVLTTGWARNGPGRRCAGPCDSPLSRCRWCWSHFCLALPAEETSLPCSGRAFVNALTSTPTRAGTARPSTEWCRRVGAPTTLAASCQSCGTAMASASTVACGKSKRNDPHVHRSTSENGLLPDWARCRSPLPWRSRSPTWPPTPTASCGCSVCSVCSTFLEPRGRLSPRKILVPGAASGKVPSRVAVRRGDE